ncbi:hypothetical protein BN946_scf184884.g41 [Trametes cinnabarina]|uniref:Oxidoreductase molybdopterin-binding domain-containing protein n=1 Tax=Pycnoporus cinnabarinus TaxID=5643 RepID=A0A060S5Z3_PYCCI|nr:hypothetical protein BN946_scf184884.g41 [Trametes cinnabarina]
MAQVTVPPSQTDSSSNGFLLNQFFPEERPGWRGFVEWEGRPERKRVASAILQSKKFSPIPEFQFVPLPKTNPVLIGYRWKEYHEALGLKNIVDFSWETVLKEKPGMIHLLDFPYNGETPRSELIKDKITDNLWHFVRNHGGVPDIDEDAFKLEIGGLVNNAVKLTMKDLKDATKFPRGEREPCTIGQGTAVYRGVPLKKVLKIACGGILPEAQHLEFIGADTYFKKGNVFNYAVSVPWRKVRNNEEVLLAWEMNGKPLPKIHGYPLRVVVTGYIGARSAKWVYKINALAEPSMGPVQSQEYLYYTQQIGKQNVKYSNGFSIQNMPVSSAIIYPQDKQVVIHDGHVELKGWSYSGGGNWVERVEVSPDGWDLHVTSSCHRIKVYSVNTSRPATAQRLAEIKTRGEDFNPLTRPLPWSLEGADDYLKLMRKHPREPLN